MLVLPAIAWLLGALGWREPRRVRAVRAAVAGYAVLVVATAVLALQ